MWRGRRSWTGCHYVEELRWKGRCVEDERWGARVDRLMKNRDLHVKMGADRDAWREGGARRQTTRLGMQMLTSSRQ